MKKCVLIISIFILIFVSVLPASAAVPYGHVTEDTSQVKILIEAMLNDPALSPFSKWFVYRAGEYDYRLYFNIDSEEGDGSYYYYTGIQSGYNITWTLTRGESTVPDIDVNDPYTVVGNMNNMLGSSLYRQHHFYMLSLPIFIMLLFISVIYVFRHRRNL